MNKYAFTLINSLTFVSPGCVEKTEPLPNIIFILADDLGYGDIGCYGQKLIPTPNINLLADEGILFTQHYAGSTVSAPSRSSLMTGQHTGHTPIRGNKSMPPEGQYPLKREAITIAELLKEAGYVTGAFGKWGLGSPGSDGDPLNQGFDEFYGYLCQSLAHNYYPLHLWDNGQKIMLEGNRDSLDGLYAPFLIHEKTLNFIERNKAKPFFCYIATILPHAELIAPEEYLHIYRGKFLPEKYYSGCDPGCAKFKTGGYRSQPESHAAFAAMIHILDEQVGQILRKLKELGISDNTILFFTSDNGPHMEGGADPDYFDSNSEFKGYKRDLYEGGIRVPFLVRWPNKIKASSATDHISAFWDVLPTLAEITGVKTPDDIDGISFLPSLVNKGQQVKHEYLYWEFYELGGRKAIRKDQWKAIQYNVMEDPDSSIMLYNILLDRGEEQDVSSEHPEIVDEMKHIMKEAHIPSDYWKW